MRTVNINVVNMNFNKTYNCFFSITEVYKKGETIPFTGKIIADNPDGKIHGTFTIKNGKANGEPHGKFTYYDECGNMSSIEN